MITFWEEILAAYDDSFTNWNAKLTLPKGEASFGFVKYDFVDSKNYTL